MIECHQLWMPNCSAINSKFDSMGAREPVMLLFRLPSSTSSYTRLEVSFSNHHTAIDSLAEQFQELVND